jgi:calcineurin-like phosphoesterase family protein
MIYLISDTHFNHKNVIAYENRPFPTADLMNDTMIKNWNSIVKDDDIVIHLGDVALGKETSLKYIIPSLKGRKILIKGNHDGKSKQFYYDCGFEEVVHTKFLEYKGQIIFLSHEPSSRPGDKKEKYDLHCYGHVHSKYQDELPTIARNGACLCVERWGYKPVSLDEIIELCKKSGISSSLI